MAVEPNPVFNADGVSIERRLFPLAGLGHVVTGPLLPRQAARCLRFIQEHPGSSGAEVQDGIGIRHSSQITRLLARLERDGLAHAERDRRALNHWRLTERGTVVLAGLPDGIYE